MHLRDESTVVHWPRSATIMHPELGIARPDMDQIEDLRALALGRDVEVAPSVEKTIGDHLADELRDDARLNRLKELDQRYIGWIPGFYQNSRQIIERAEAMHATRRMFVPPRSARPTLPASAARRATLLAELKPKRIFMEDDVDGLAVLMGEQFEIELYEPNQHHRAWLRSQAGTELTFVSSPRDQAFDLTVICAGPPAILRASLETATRATKPGGFIAISVRSPWEWPLFTQIEETGLTARAYEREVDHWLLPSGSVVDGAGDLLILERSEQVRLPTVDHDPAERVRAQPYFTIDLDSLDEDRLDEQSITRFADLVAEQSPVPEAMRSVQRDDKHDLLCWYDERGYGLSAELKRHEKHFMMTLMPFCEELEYAAICAAYIAFAGRFTRSRPLRTKRSHEETLFG